MTSNESGGDRLENLLSMKIDAKDKDGNAIKISPEFVVSVQGIDKGGVKCIIHADGHNSDTVDFTAFGNMITVWP